jgi:hypothetical protein
MHPVLVNADDEEVGEESDFYGTYYEELHKHIEIAKCIKY